MADGPPPDANASHSVTLHVHKLDNKHLRYAASVNDGIQYPSTTVLEAIKRALAHSEEAPFKDDLPGHQTNHTHRDYPSGSIAKLLTYRNNEAAHTLEEALASLGTDGEPVPDRYAAACFEDLAALIDPPQESAAEPVERPDCIGCGEPVEGLLRELECSCCPVAWNDRKGWQYRPRADGCSHVEFELLETTCPDCYAPQRFSYAGIESCPNCYWEDLTP